MTLKEELEILRGEPIQVFAGDPMDIPYIETSDSEKLCKHPVVSVHMITYNHEPYIRQAIEGVMMQKTDFEFELVIGEDASTDKTREICFEYQKKYPDKIRVLWWHENLYRNPHPAGGNGKRTTAHCRGEFIAFCEGDDYWIDPLKLQKQVDIMRKHPSVGLCFCGAKRYYVESGKELRWDGASVFTSGLIKGRYFALVHMFGAEPAKSFGPERFIITSTCLCRRGLIEKIKSSEEIMSWRLVLSDTTLWTGLALRSAVYFINEEVSVYRIHKQGACGVNGFKIPRDGALVRMYYANKYFGLNMSSYPARFIISYIETQRNIFASKGVLKEYLRKVVQRIPSTLSFKTWLTIWIMEFDVRSRLILGLMRRVNNIIVFFDSRVWRKTYLQAVVD